MKTLFSTNKLQPFGKMLLTTALITALATGCSKDNDDTYINQPPPPPAQPPATVFSAAGDSSAIIGTVNQFRSLLGDSLNFVTGKTDGRREVNWDGVPADFSNNSNFPPDFFNSINPADPGGRKRGLLYINTGAGLRVDSSLFADIDASYATQFQFFSRKRLIINSGSNISEAVFKVAGTNTAAFVKGFGIIFSDVDNASTTSIEFFNNNKSLGIYKAPARNAQGGFSFLGVYFKAEKVTSVKITSGNGVLAPGTKDMSDGGNNDLVVMDDFFYNEPLASGY